MHQQEQNKHELTVLFNDITTHFLCNATYHHMSSLRCLETGVYRGLARWHSIESKDDYDHIETLSKHLVDQKDVVAIQNPDELKSLYQIHTGDWAKQLKNHLDEWHARESRCLVMLNDAKYKLIMMKEFTLAGMLQPFIQEIEGERFSIERLLKRFKFTEWSYVDICRVMKCLHKYFEHEYSRGECINFDI